MRSTIRVPAPTQIWALTEEYVAIRDLKMCPCGADFVHGLALPRFTVMGVEDPQRPNAIWRFTSDAAQKADPRRE